MSAESATASFEVAAEHNGERLDRVVARLLPEYSRARIQRWIKDGEVLLNGAAVAARHGVRAGDHIVVSVSHAETEPAALPEALPLDICYQDQSLLVIEKPAGLVMHIGPGNYTGTLQNGLLHFDPGLNGVPRAGIVHRLDKDTSGLIVVARSLQAHNSLVSQLQRRSVHRVYQAVACGVPVSGGTVDQPIGRHPVDRKRMSVNPAGKQAVTHYRVLQKFRHHSHLRLQLETGRTHQIRVHMAHQRFPLVGDPVYSGRKRRCAGLSDELNNAVTAFPRQALHAAELGFQHPQTGEPMKWQSELPLDMQRLLNALAAEIC